ncbi:Protein BREVIS RADIX [Apostasia shenzhenica]|uniref:Protein BREVIS RADIX n=1 Tax=Apostasia shenzhenica TaxID=1088818 RepID=A0A2I0B8L7_9ASPA|nr:Protein BREVIS RADIX [Apostasia shenzhenica]
MLACIACAKPELEEGGDSTARAGAPSTKDAVKSLSSQLKDMVLKFTGAYRQCEGAGGTTSYRNRPHHRYPLVVGEDYPTTDHSRERYAYLQAASSSSTPAWDFTSIRSDEGSASARAKCVIPGGSAAGKASVESDVALEDDGEAKEWIAQVEPGVQITFLSLPGGAGNDLKRIRFRSASTFV